MDPDACLLTCRTDALSGDAAGPESVELTRDPLGEELRGYFVDSAATRGGGRKPVLMK
jgi:hypothetical protein